jgi:hypothetical protein
MKTCSACKRAKPASAFYRHSKTKDGLQTACRECQRARSASRNAAHYRRWRNINDRVFKTTHKEFHNYGGRGITMAPEWANDYEAFKIYIESELGPCPEGHSLDRIDNDGHYVPGNLRWATPLVQTHNRRVSVVRWEKAAEPPPRVFPDGPLSAVG